jgi:hypothetical protein
MLKMYKPNTHGWLVLTSPKKRVIKRVQEKESERNHESSG